MEMQTTSGIGGLPAFAAALAQDLRAAVRVLLRMPMLSAAVILTLALGIGANTAIFSLLDTVVLRSLPVTEPEQLLVLGERQSMTSITASDGWERDTSFYSVPLATALRRHSDVFSEVAAFSSFPVYDYLDSDQSAASATRREPVETRLVSGSFFQTLGVTAAMGRTISDEDNRVAGGHPVVVVSHAYWQRSLGGRPGVVGETLRLNGLAYTIIGVTPPGFHGVTLGMSIDCWAPLAMQAQLMQERSYLDDPDTMWLRVIGRRRPEVTPAMAAERTNTLLRQLLLAEVGSEVSEQTRAEIAKHRVELVPFAKGFSLLRQRYAQPLGILMAVVAMVLLISCANVGNLLLARASSRRHEIALRLALGSGRGRLVRQLLVESLLLALLGGALGLVVAHWVIAFLLGMISDGSLPLQVGLDLRVLGFTAAISLLTAVLFGLVPALRSSRVDLHPVLRGQAVLDGGPGRGWSLRKVLVVGQVAVSLPLLIGAGLFLRSLDNLRSQDLGFRTDSLLQVEIDPRGGGYSQEQLPGLYAAILRQVEALPGVESASLSLNALLDGGRWVDEAHVDNGRAATAEERQIQLSFVTPGFLETAGASLRAGRFLDEHDRQGAPQVAIVNETFAHAMLGDGPVLGRRFGIKGEESSRDIEIVGLVRDLKSHGLWGDAPRMAYIPVDQNVQYLEALQVRTRQDPASLAPQVKQVLSTVAPQLPYWGMRTLEQEIERSLRQERMLSQLTSVFGLLALLLAAIGLYGVLAYGVTSRTREIGVRIALGAARSRVLWMVLRTALTWVVVGMVLGLGAALIAGRLVAGLLFALSPTDHLTMVLATATLLLIAALASYLPARRAARLDPVRALRYE